MCYELAYRIVIIKQ